MRPLSRAGTDGEAEPPFSVQRKNREYQCDNDNCRQRLIHEQLMEKGVQSDDRVTSETKKADETRS